MKKQSNIFQTFFAAMVVITAISFAPTLFNIWKQNVAEREIAECQTWIDQSKEFEGFYLVQWQRDQCQTLGVDVSWIKTAEEADQFLKEKVVNLK